jgi:hypothetical protein
MSARHLPVDYSDVVNAVARAAVEYEAETGLRARRILVAPDVHKALLERLRALCTVPMQPKHDSAIDPNAIQLHGCSVELDEYAPMGSFEADDCPPARYRPRREGERGGFSMADLSAYMREYDTKMREVARSQERLSHPILAAFGLAARRNA